MSSQAQSILALALGILALIGNAFTVALMIWNNYRREVTKDE